LANNDITKYDSVRRSNLLDAFRTIEILININ